MGALSIAQASDMTGSEQGTKAATAVTTKGNRTAASRIHDSPIGGLHPPKPSHRSIID
ncbi:hypothetical protein M427DRAFT_59791 [Gonapodya prolifera JEL478]|uniref:Uncharacterized protein n=1 Tax=Gonapodya prolifera (strain JEL478) TaxID=1344416 RepID=A0A139A5P6_GONPJ|nr:hypothetical protein M427DRAFT_59791 [Gonapodya prolifera JEL478]|eukprot:KXS12107.1 hypothetical protein M427DRAFT_59791 [Gonapodya prolifera JEL478]